MSDYSNCSLTLLSITVTTPTLPLVVECPNFTSASIDLDPSTPIAFRFSSLLVVGPAVRSGLQRRVIIKLFKDAYTPLTNLVLKVLVKRMPSGPSQS